MLLILEEKSLYWNDDKEVVDTFVLKTIKRFEQENKADQELLPEYKDLEDRDFARKLFRSTILNCDQYQRYMSDASRNWDFSRLAYMDVVIMQIAIAEMVNFPNIPASVTINEYVDLAKVYSTPRSGGYVNGMLDNIGRFLIDRGIIAKELPCFPNEARAFLCKRRYYRSTRFVRIGRCIHGGFHQRIYPKVWRKILLHCRRMRHLVCMVVGILGK